MKITICSLVALCVCIQSFGQEKSKEIEELRLKLNEDGSHYLKATFLNQIWLRENQSNPGTTVLGDVAKQTTDVGLRRTRFQFYGQLTDHVFFYFQFGQNNFNYLSQNSGNRKLQAFFHDALAEYKIKKGSDRFIVGSGLTITNGLSRYSQPSVSTIMTLDVPVFAQATVDQTDEFSRKLSTYARGQLGKLDYRLVYSDPFPITTNGQPVQPVSTNATFSSTQHHKQYQGLLVWNFFDTENHTTPYMTGTYLGKKKVLNLETGFISQKNATITTDGTNNAYHNMTLLAIALYYDAPVNKEKGTAISAYGGYFNYDYGPGYLRYNGIMNPASGLSATPNTFPVGSQGNSFPMFGTGKVIYAQLGYLLPKDLLGDGHGALMPFASWMSADYDRLNKQMNVMDVGINWLIKSHNSKITLDYQTRPTYSQQGSELVRESTRGQVLIQYQIFF